MMPERVEIALLTPESLADVVIPCRQCLYWESPSRFRAEASEREQVEAMLLKQRWLDRHARWSAAADLPAARLESGAEHEAGGLIAKLGGESSGHLSYVLGRLGVDLLPRLREYAVASQVGADALFITCLYVSPDKRGKGISAALLGKAGGIAESMGLAALETIARRGSADNPSGPLELYLKHGFAVKAEDPEFPLVRKSLL
jgi:GNAT superfamily N-acetyltransferase